MYKCSLQCLTRKRKRGKEERSGEKKKKRVNNVSGYIFTRESNTRVLPVFYFPHLYVIPLTISMRCLLKKEGKEK